MNKIMNLILVCFLGISCNSTKVTSSWKADNAVTKHYRNVMVWGILPETDSVVKRQIETHLTNDLIGKGYHAVSSAAVYKSKAFKNLSSKEIVDEFKFTGVDAVITLVLLKKEKEQKYYSSDAFAKPMINPDNLDKYYHNMYEKVFTPGYYVTTTNYFWEANLFEVKDDKLIYSVRTKSFDQVSTETLAHENGLKIMKDMMKKKIILNHVPIKD